MPYLALEQANRIEILGFFPTDSRGFLYDPESVEFRVLDSSGATVIDWTDVTSSGRRGVGAYYAPFTPSSPDFEVQRNYSIEWRWTDEDGADDLTWSLVFDVYTAGFGLPYRTYLTPNRIRSEGVDTSELSDARAIELIARAQQFIERECRQPFRPILHTVEFDGGGGGGLWQAPMPILGVEYLRANGSSSNLDTAAFEVYSSPHLGGDPGWRPSNNRGNPKIRLGRAAVSIFAGPRVVTGSRFSHGAKAHSVKGVWGFVEADGTTPILIEDAMLRVVLATSTLMEAGVGATTVVAGPIIREETDLHEIEYASNAGSASNIDALAGSAEVSDILKRYRAPIGVATPATTWFSRVP